MKLSTLILTAAGLAVASAQYGCNVDKVICCVNNYRAKYGLKPLNKDSSICRACQKHSQYMSGRRSLDHSGSGGSSAGTRMRGEGVDVGGWAENIASGQKTEDAVCAAWIKSAGHRRNIVGNYDAVCVARYGDYWTQDFVNYSGSGNAVPVRCSGSAPVSTPHTTTTSPSSGGHVTYRKVLYRKVYSSNGHLYYKYYYKLVPVYTRSYHDASGDDYTDTPKYDYSDVKDVAADYEPEGDYDGTETVEYDDTAPAAEEPHYYKPKCTPKTEPTSGY